jgi:AcrR family transcriptional regulator
MVTKVTAVLPGRAARRDAVRNRERVLAAADEVFAEQGLEATLADIAERAGVGIGTIYRRFPDKQSLIAALLDDKLALVEATAAEAAIADTGWEAFRGLLVSLSGLLQADLALAEILTADDDRESGHRILDAIRPTATKIIKRAQAEGTLRADVRFNDLSPLLVMATAASSFVTAGNPRSRARYIEVVLDGVRARPDLPPLPGRALTDAELRAASRGTPDRQR